MTAETVSFMRLLPFRGKALLCDRCHAMAEREGDVLLNDRHRALECWLERLCCRCRAKLKTVAEAP